MKIKIRRADKLFSDYIRTRDKWICQNCGNKPDKQGLHCSHYWGRGRESTRFEPDNCISLCFYCHLKLGHGDGRDRYRMLMIKRLGEKRFKSLEIQAETYKKKDDTLVILWLKQELKTKESLTNWKRNNKKCLNLKK